MQKKTLRRLLAAMMALALLLGSIPAFAAGEEDWMNILLLGCDSYTKNSRQRTDSMIILSLNTRTNRVKMTSLMRDTWITVPGHTNHRKLTELCAVGGPDLTIRAINDNFDMNIEKYALISLEGIAEVIDLLGGVELDVTEAERKALNKGLFDLSSLSGMEQLEESGEQVHLNGNQATAFARIRKIDSDYVRTERQRTVLVEMARKLKAGANPATLLSIVSTLSGYVETNLSLPELLALAQAGLNVDLDGIEQFRVPADGTFKSGMFDGIWCIKPNFEKNARLLNEFIYSEDEEEAAEEAPAEEPAEEAAAAEEIAGEETAEPEGGAASSEMAVVVDEAIGDAE